MSRGYAVYFNHTGVAVVTWDPTLQAVYSEAQGWADSSEMAVLLEAGLQALTEHRGSRWLADGRNMKVIKQSDQGSCKSFSPAPWLPVWNALPWSCQRVVWR